MSRLENWKAQIKAEYKNIPDDVIDWILVVNENNPDYFKKLKKDVEKKQKGRPKKETINETLSTLNDLAVGEKETVLETVTIKLPEEEKPKFKVENDGIIKVDLS